MTVNAALFPYSASDNAVLHHEPVLLPHPRQQWYVTSLFDLDYC